MIRLQGTDGVRRPVRLSTDLSLINLSPVESFVDHGVMTEQFVELYSFCRIRSLIEETLRTDPEIAESAKVSKEVSCLYDLRSSLVHTGKADNAIIREGNNRLNEVILWILRVHFRETAQCD